LDKEGGGGGGYGKEKRSTFLMEGGEKGRLVLGGPSRKAFNLPRHGFGMHK